MFSPNEAIVSVKISVTFLSESLIYVCSIKQDSWKNLVSLPSTIFSIILSGFPSDLAWSE